MLPDSDVVVHVEPSEHAALRERAHAAALGVPRVREVHNLTVLDVAGTTEISLHLKLPGDLPLDEAHAVAEAVERAILAAVPEVSARPDAHRAARRGRRRRGGRGRRGGRRADRREATGAPPRGLRFLHTDGGLVAHLTLGDGLERLARRRARARERDRAADPRRRSPRSQTWSFTRNRARRALSAKRTGGRGLGEPERSPSRASDLRPIRSRAMRLCMFHPEGHPLERGWVGRIDDAP